MTRTVRPGPTPAVALVEFVIMFVLAPGPRIHELAHAIVGRRYGDVSIEWGLVRSAVVLEWDDAVPVWGVVGYFTAPLVLAGVLALGAALVVEAIAALPWIVQVYLGVNYLALAGPSGADLVGLLATLTQG